MFCYLFVDVKVLSLKATTVNIDLYSKIKENCLLVFTGKFTLKKVLTKCVYFLKCNPVSIKNYKLFQLSFFLENLV